MLSWRLMFHKSFSPRSKALELLFWLIFPITVNNIYVDRVLVSCADCCKTSFLMSYNFCIYVYFSNICGGAKYWALSQIKELTAFMQKAKVLMWIHCPLLYSVCPMGDSHWKLRARACGPIFLCLFFLSVLTTAVEELCDFRFWAAQKSNSFMVPQVVGLKLQVEMTEGDGMSGNMQEMYLSQGAKQSSGWSFLQPGGWKVQVSLAPSNCFLWLQHVACNNAMSHLPHFNLSENNSLLFHIFQYY